ncbi:MAG: formate/nitrite transporter family protein [Clostridiales bacterium]|nr:formate/nitrite transporter family protein [Clostridiales bacterium]
MFTPSEIAHNYIEVAKKKTSLKWYKILILGILAGAFIAFGAAVATATSAGLTGSRASLVKGAVFPVGLILVVICGAELFTGNCLLVSPAIGKDVKVRSVLKNWSIVYAGNFIGGVLIALLVVFSHIQKGAVAEACANTAAAKCNLSFFESFLRGILCNMLVCLAVWGAMASKSTAGKILALYAPIFAFVACGFEHSVANMYYLSAGLLTKATVDSITAAGLTVGRALLFSLLPSTLGNIIGGGLIGCAYHAVYRSKNKPNTKQENAPTESTTAEQAPVKQDSES